MSFLMLMMLMMRDAGDMKESFDATRLLSGTGVRMVKEPFFSAGVEPRKSLCVCPRLCQTCRPPRLPIKSTFCVCSHATPVQHAGGRARGVLQNHIHLQGRLTERKNREKEKKKKIKFEIITSIIIYSKQPLQQ